MSKDVTEYYQNKVIKVGRGGPESRIGMLLDKSADYIAVLTEEDGVIYYNTHHIKSYTENMKGKFKFDLEVPEDFEFKKAEDFKGLLESLAQTLPWVKINRGGPDSVEGILNEVENDFVCLISSEEVIRISIFHIKNVSYGVKIEKAEPEEQESRQKSNEKSENNKNKSNSTTQNGSSQKSRQKSNDGSEKTQK